MSTRGRPRPLEVPLIAPVAPPRSQSDRREDSSCIEITRNVLRTLIFYDLFGCPLRLDELAERTFGGLPDAWRNDPKPMIEADTCLADHVTIQRGFVFLRTGSPAFDQWEAAELARRRAVRRYEKWVRLICRLPFVRMVAVTGSLAFPMSSGRPDCDLFVVTARDRLWITVALTRALFFRILPALRLIRHGDICPNYMIDEQSSFGTAGDLFDAMQLAAMNPVIGHETHADLISNSKCLSRFFPHWQPPAPLFESITDSPPHAVRRLLEFAARAFPLDRLNRRFYRRLSRRFLAVPGRKDVRTHVHEIGTAIRSAWVREAFDLTANAFRFSHQAFKAHDGRKLELLARFDEALRNHPASASIDLTGGTA